MSNSRPAVAAVGVSLIAIANAFGRIAWGKISDIIGRYNSLPIMFVILSISMLLLLTVETGTWARFIVLVMAIGFCFGGFMGIYPAITADKFGLKNNGVNYGFMFIGFALGGYIGPKLVALLEGQAFMVAGIMSIAGLIISLIIRRKYN